LLVDQFLDLLVGRLMATTDAEKPVSGRRFVNTRVHQKVHLVGGEDDWRQRRRRLLEQ
jgi:hypothetical protein